MSKNEDNTPARNRDDRDKRPARRDEIDVLIDPALIEEIPAYRKLNAMDGKLDALLVGQAALATDVFLTPLKILGGGAVMLFAWDQVNRRGK